MMRGHVPPETRTRRIRRVAANTANASEKRKVTVRRRRRRTIHESTNAKRRKSQVGNTPGTTMTEVVVSVTTEIGRNNVVMVVVVVVVGAMKTENPSRKAVTGDVMMIRKTHGTVAAEMKRMFRPAPVVVVTIQVVIIIIIMTGSGNTNTGTMKETMLIIRMTIVRAVAGNATTNGSTVTIRNGIDTVAVHHNVY